MKFIGADWAKGKWLAFILDENGSGYAKTFPDIKSLWNEHKDAELILIDIPIGLPDTGNKSRLCDIKAREYIGKRKSSVFPVPCREALQADDREEASGINKKQIERGVSHQTWGIARPVKEVDFLLRDNAHAREIIRETHPEVCFTAFNGGKPMDFNKKKPEGYSERVKVLRQNLKKANKLIKEIRKSLLTKDAGDDDILDALVCAVTAFKGKDGLSRLGDGKSDSDGLPMQIVYYKL